MAGSGSHLYAGLMSGTSLDGVDAALVDFSAPDLSETVCHLYRPYPDDLRSELLGLCSPGPDELARSQRAAIRIAECYAEALGKILSREGVGSDEVMAAGCHGQTVRHDPAGGWTAQLLNPHVLAERSGVDVVCDLRGRDMARGGQGAPLAPLFHAQIFSAPRTKTAVVNIGGISNITVLPPGKSGDMLAYDIGPGGMLMDAWAQLRIAKPYDEGGRWASEGAPDADLLERMLAWPYFREAPPKSTGREMFGVGWLEQHGVETLDPADVQATLLELTAALVADNVGLHPGARRVVLCGGGARNGRLVARIRARLPQAEVLTSGELGYPESWVEAATFAYLAKMRMERAPVNTSDITGGASGGHVAGAVVCR